MEEKIYLKTLLCYQKATEEQRKKYTRKQYYNLSQLPTEQLKQEWTAYIEACGKKYSLSTVQQQIVYFNQFVRFINSMSETIYSMKDMIRAQWEQNFGNWLIRNGRQLYRACGKDGRSNCQEKTPVMLYFLHMLDFNNSELMEQRIYLKNMPCFQHASKEQQEKCGMEPYFNLSQLPSPQLRAEWEAFIKRSSEVYTLGTLFQQRVYYNQICRFINSRQEKVKSMKDCTKDQWLLQFKGWMIAEGIQLQRTRHCPYNGDGFTRNPNISYLIRMLEFTKPDTVKDEVEKDIWELDKLPFDINQNPINRCKTLNFTGIEQLSMRSEVKRGIYMQLQREAIGTVMREMTVVKHLTKYLRKKHPKMQSLGELNRDIFEEYLIYLKIDDTTSKELHTEITRLRSLLKIIGKLCNYSLLENLIINRDIPSLPRAAFKSYSDEELKRLNAEIIKMDEQIARLLIIHQMLGTRISDAMTLQIDCVRVHAGEKIIHIRQVKTHPYEKPISEEIEMLIQASIKYTENRYGSTKYIFVSDSDPSRPMQYNRVQSRIVQMIHDKDLRDDDGKLFGFGTHMFRHSYGVKLTEMHLDDWTIARLLGHSSVHNVKYYRKMSNQRLADETRAVRQKISQMILENLEGWGEEYEQVRYDAGCE